MGWSIEITSLSREITEKDVEAALERMPKDLRQGMFPAVSRQGWGWSAAVDVNNPNGKKITLSGSYSISGMIAEEFAKSFVTGLKVAGHVVKTGRMR